MRDKDTMLDFCGRRSKRHDGGVCRQDRQAVDGAPFAVLCHLNYNALVQTPAGYSATASQIISSFQAFGPTCSTLIYFDSRQSRSSQVQFDRAIVIYSSFPFQEQAVS